ncbi:MAG: hypothetical protein KKH29_00230 [Candidatus Omnitrophica bacterium]|nr:hypothetical protein [Candidatus Omnitrophota bacterium]MBU4345737.1 hypothetical protein [Candidatus Omnitrophota bacterium]MBU4472743.1 hypothetical protein [Candidatus Omnitrophota bacterium]
MKIAEREKAIELRKKGLTYNEIVTFLKVSRSSLSYWLRNIPYIPTGEVRERRRLASLQSGQVLHKRKLERITKIEKIARQEIGEIEFDELKLLGIMAYWVEGSKTEDAIVRFTNSDPIFIKFILRWLREICKVQDEKLRAHLRVHPDVDKKEAENYWSKVTGIPLAQFYKTTAKISGSGGRKYKKLGSGIAAITVCDTDLHYRIKGWIDGLKNKSIYAPVVRGVHHTANT